MGRMLPQPVTGVRLADAVQIYLGTITVANTRATYAAALERLVADFGADTDVALLASEPDRVSGWFTYVWGAKSAKTFNIRLTALGSAFAYWREQQWLAGDPLIRLRARPAPLVVDEAGEAVAPVRRFLAEFVAQGNSARSVRSYAYALLRGWRWLRVVDVAWDKATAGETRDLVLWLGFHTKRRNSPRTKSLATAGTVNPITRKRYLDDRYAARTIRAFERGGVADGADVGSRSWNIASAQWRIRFAESAAQLVGEVVVGGGDFVEVDQGGEVDDGLVVGQEPGGVFDDALFVAGIEAEFGQGVGVDDEFGFHAVAALGEANTVFVVEDEFDIQVFGHGVRAPYSVRQVG
ncbi:hypothetical protein ACFZC5_17505 [Nocardia gamkensis]|uniref:hypothetical protein n=1 Tax=Nocardia gamkensis TaxID=352869 RepID=UPI0036EB4ADE